MADWTWAAASRRSTAHAQLGERRQDAFRIAAPRGVDGFLTLVACDGAGSAMHGGEGASLTAWTLIECARAWLSRVDHLPDEEEVVAWAAIARLRIIDAAQARGLLLYDFATTLVMAMSNGVRTLTVHIGDGAIVGRDAATDAWLPLSWPRQGEFAATTFFLTDAVSHMQVACHETLINRLAVLTDGMERLALDFASTAPHAPFFEAMTKPVAEQATGGINRALSRQLAAYLDSPGVVARTDDDKTLLLAARV